MADQRKTGASRPSKKRPTAKPRREMEFQTRSARYNPVEEPKEKAPISADREERRPRRDEHLDDEFGLETVAAPQSVGEPDYHDEGHDDQDLDHDEPQEAPRTSAPRMNERPERTERSDRNERHDRDDRVDRPVRPPQGGADRNETRPQAPVAPRPPMASGPARPSDGFTVQVYFDSQSRQFMASALEVPEIKTNGPRAELVLEELLDRLDTHLDGLKSRGEKGPEAYQLRKNYPEKLTVPVSQTLYRKLDILSRQEKVALEQVVTEILAGGVDRRFDGPRSGGGRPQGGGGGQPHSNQNPGNNRHGGRDRGGRNENRGNRRFQDASVAQGDNFMEYVRNLEKGGGPGRGNWRKR